MKQLFTTLILACLLANVGYANQGGPDAYGYTWKDSNQPGGPTYAWHDISTIGTLITGLGDDNVVGPFGMGAGFNFYWYTRDQFWIGSNGYIAFNNVNIASGASGFPVFPGGSAAPNDYIAPFMCDLKHDGAANPAKVYTYQNNDSLTISFVDVPFWISTAAQQYGGLNSFQIVLNRADSSITINYKLQTGTVDATYAGRASQISMGIENVGGIVGLQQSINIYPPVNYSVKYYAPRTTTYQVLDAGVSWNNNAKNGGLFVSDNGAPRSLSSKISNVGNQPTPSFMVTSNIQSITGATSLSNGSATVPALLPNNSHIAQFTNTFNPAAPNIGPGIYKNTTGFGTNALPGDLQATNNTLVQKIIVVDTTQATIALNYADATPTAVGLSWAGGNGGVGVYFEPPFYPAVVASTQYYITSNATQVGFFAKIYDDNGPNNGPGTLLDSVFVDALGITTGVYTTVPVSLPFTVTSGGVYVLWYMDGDGIQIARDDTQPISNRTFENLNGIWGEYRDKSLEDFLVGLNIQRIAAPDLSASQILSPSPGTINQASIVKVRLRNLANGTTTQPFSVSYQITGGARITESYIGAALATGDSTDFTFSTPLVARSGNLCVKVNYPADPTLSNDSVCTAVIAVGTQNLQPNIAMVYPNPVQDYLDFQFVGGTNTQILVMDMSGKVVHETTQNDGKYRFDATHLAQGVYMYELRSNNQKQRGKFVKI